MFLFRGFVFLMVGGLLACVNASSSSSLAAPSAPANRYQAIRDYFPDGNGYSQGADFCLALDVILDVACDDNQKTSEAEYITVCLGPTFPSVLSNIINGYDSRAGQFLVSWFGQQATDILINQKQRLKAGHPWDLNHHDFDGVSDKELDQFKLISCYTEFSSPCHPAPNPSFIMIQTLFEWGFKDQLARWRNNLGESLVDYAVSYSGTEPLLQTILVQFPEEVILESVITNSSWVGKNLTKLSTYKPTMDTYINQNGFSADMFLPNMPDRKKAALTRFTVKVEADKSLSTDSLALPVRVLQALNAQPDGPYKAVRTQADIITTGGEWGIDFERAPTKQEWRVIRYSLGKISYESLKDRNFKDYLDNLSSKLFIDVEPSSWSVLPKDREAYISHKQNAYIGAVSVSRAWGGNPDDTVFQEIGSRVNLTAAQVKDRYEWLESQWQ